MFFCEFVVLKDYYYVRMIFDESFFFGVMGESGCGLIEYVGLFSSFVDVICVLLENVCVFVGGFVVGDMGVVVY